MKTIIPHSIKELGEIFLKERRLYVEIEDVVLPARGDYVHRLYAVFSCLAKDTQTNKRVKYFVRYPLFPSKMPAYMFFGDYSINETEETDMKNFVEDVARKTQTLLERYFFFDNRDERTKHNLVYVMKTDEIKVKMLEKKI